MLNKITATKAAIISMNVPHKNLIDEDIFLGIINGTINQDNWIFHLEIFFSDIPKEHIFSVLEENKLSLKNLIPVFNKMPSVYQAKHFKELIHEYVGNSI